MEPEKYFAYKVQKAREAAASDNEVIEIAKDSEDFEKIMAEAEPSEIFEDMYTVTESTAEKLKLTTNAKRFFYIDHKTMKRIIAHHLGAVKPENTSFEGTVFLRENEKDALSMYMIKKDKFTFDDGQSVQIEYDITTDRVSQVSLECDSGRMETFLLEVLPYLVPETYMTEDEIEGMFEAMAEDTFKADSRHPKFTISGYPSLNNNEIVSMYISRGSY